MKLLFVFLFTCIIFMSSCVNQTWDDKSGKKASSMVDTIKTTRREDSVSTGRALFIQNCAACHSLGGKVVGPGLLNITKRVPQPYKTWLPKYIKNNVAVMKSGDAYALQVYKDNDSTSMPVYDSVLNDNQVHYIILFLEDPPSEMIHHNQY